MQAAWDGIDKIYCISLTGRHDRQVEALAQFDRVGLARRVEFVLVEKHPLDCEQGIYESHLLCLRKGLAAGAERMLIFEDDIVFDRMNPTTLTAGMNFMRNHERWHMLFLGCMVSRSRRTAYPSILRIAYRSLTHGYVIHRRFAEVLAGRPWQKIPYDDFLRDLKDDQMYALYPSIAFQSDSTSDNERYLPLDRFRRICGGLQKIQKRNEFYHHNKVLIVGAHILVVFVITLRVLL
jgi:GR25 family glycosyltransferase involved in LPS biosynthesis